MNRVLPTTALATLLAVALPTVGQAQSEKVQIAVVVDVSRRVRGYVDRARERVNAAVLEAMNAPGSRAELALHTYGAGGVREVLEFTSRPEEFTEKLNEVYANENLSGGQEPCGHALTLVADDPAWSTVTNDLRIILIVGNESFDQTTRTGGRGTPHSRKGTDVARGLPNRTVETRSGDVVRAPIMLNTLHVGPRAEAERNKWKEAADLGRGTFENIDGR